LNTYYLPIELPGNRLTLDELSNLSEILQDDGSSSFQKVVELKTDNPVLAAFAQAVTGGQVLTVNPPKTKPKSYTPRAKLLQQSPASSEQSVAQVFRYRITTGALAGKECDSMSQLLAHRKVAAGDVARHKIYGDYLVVDDGKKLTLKKIDGSQPVERDNKPKSGNGNVNKLDDQDCLVVANPNRDGAL
jgi:hypothetical protein